MQQDREKWQSIHARRTDPPNALPAFLSPLIPTPRHTSANALDLASGKGAMALELAQRGYATHAVDIAPIALEQLHHFAQQRDLSIITTAIDLDAPPGFPHRYDLVCLLHYKPDASQWPWIIDRVNDNGRLLLCTFNQEHHIRKGFNARFCLQPEELLATCAAPTATTHQWAGFRHLNCLHYASYEANTAYYDVYLFENTASAPAV